MSEKTNKYNLRNKSHALIGQFSKLELIEAIQSGKYSGDEEVCQEGSLKWHRLASNPVFYDAFLKRVHGKDYAFVCEEKEKEPVVKKQKDNETEVHGETLNRTDKGHKKEKGTGLTLRDSEIKSLFKSESIEKTEVQAEEFKIPSKEEEEKSLPKIQMTFNEKQGEVRQNNTAVRNRDRRRIAMWGIVILLVLVSLFNLGREKAEQENGIVDKNISDQEKNEVASLQPVVFSNEILIRLASFYSVQDTLPGYRGARNILNLGNYSSENSLDIIKHKSAALAELVILETYKEEYIKDLKALLVLGREKDPQASEFYRAEAKIYFAEKNYAEAKKLAVRAKESNPEDPENTLLLSELALESKDLADSKVLLETVESSLDSSVRKQKTLARINLVLQSWGVVENSAEKCIAASPAQSECYFLLSEGYANQNQLKKARAFLDLSARLSPFASKDVAKLIFERLSRLEETLGKEEDAKRYQKFVTLFGENTSAKNEDTKEVRKEWENFVVTDDFMIKRAREQEREKRMGSAVKYYIAATSIEPRSREGILLLGKALETEIPGADGYKTAEALYQVAIKADSAFVKAFVRMGAMETDQYNFDKGHSHLMHALQLDNNDSDALFELGKHYFRRQDYVSALDMLLKAKQNNFQSDEMYYYFGLVRQKLDRSKIREAMEAFYTAYSLNPENYDALCEWLKLKLLASEKAFAIKFLKSIQIADPKNAEIIRVMGDVYLANSEPRRAITYFHRSLDLNNASSKTRMSLARALESIGELDTAAEEFHEASRIDPKNAEGFYESARVLFQLQNYPKMAVVVSKLQELSPNYPGSHKLGSLVAQSTGDKAKAISEMRKEVENNPENYSFVIEFAELYMRFNMFNEAIVELSKITNLPTETAPDKTKASQYIKVRLTAYYLLSGCYRLLAKPEMAEGAVKLGLKVDSENALLRRELCFVYADEQRFPEATRECESYLKRNPAAEDVDRIKQKLKDMNIDYY